MDTHESSVNRAAKALSRFLSRSYIIMMKRIGPRTVPCGTPDITGEGEEMAPLAATCCVLLFKKEYRNTPTLPPILSSFILL